MMQLDSELIGAQTLRKRLYEVLEDLKEGRCTPEFAVANAKLAHAIVDSTKNSIWLETLKIAAEVNKNAPK